ncbi:conserved hypothetical protein [metagenome]
MFFGMVSQPILIGIIAGVFFAGLGIGYAVLQSAQPNYSNMTPQQMQQMMNNPQMMNQWHQTMMNDPQTMNNWMNTMTNNPNMMNQWMGNMMNNPNMMNNMMGPMMNNPQMNQQMMNMMMGNQQFMHGMMMNPQFQQNWMGPWMNNSTNWNGMMGSDMMNQGMMGNNMMGPGMMMGTPITKQSDVIITINNIEKILDQASSAYRSGDQNTALSLATNAYLENYEYIEGAIAQKDRLQMEKIEIMMRVDLRSMINNGDTSGNVDAKINSIKSELGKVKTLFQ